MNLKYFSILIVSILFEVFATSMLNLSQGFSVIGPTIALFIGYAISFTLLVIALSGIPLSIAYSVWAGLGTVGTAIVGIFLFNEVLTLINISGLVIIIVGVIVMNMSGNKEETEESVV